MQTNHPNKSIKHTFSRRQIVGGIALCIGFLLCALLTYFLYRVLQQVGGTPEAFRDFIRSFGLAGWLVAIGIQFVQVVVALVPGEVVEIGMGCAFGAVGGTVLCMVGVALASAVVFLLTRRFGVRLLQLFFPIQKIRELRFINNEKRLESMVFLLFFIPGTPKDLLTYFVGLTHMSMSRFLCISLLARIPSVVSSVIGGAFLGTEEYASAILVLSVTGVVSLMGMVLYNYILKRKKFAGVPPTSKRVVELFLKLCAIPHGSGNLTAVTRYCVRFAKRIGLIVQVDKAGNVWIEKPATAGMETVPPVILQAHLDMVCEKDPQNAINMHRTAVTPVFDGDVLCADGTTLGADNGVGVAMALAILEDKQAVHGPLQVLLTADEEVGMLGAKGLDATHLKANRLINLDSEEEGVLIAGCAGGLRAECAMPLSFEPVKGNAFTVELSGLKGGHSGVDIDKGRANANVELLRLLAECRKQVDIQWVACNGGTVDNAIAAACVATVVVPPAQESVFREMVSACGKRLCETYATADDGLTVTLTETNGVVKALSVNDTAKVLEWLTSLPNGIWETSEHFEGKPYTSLNMGVLTDNGKEVRAFFALRSFSTERVSALCKVLTDLTVAAGGNVQTGGEYPAWDYVPQCPLREHIVSVYTDMFGVAPTVDIIHAGLECAAFVGKHPQLHCVSLGPAIAGAHTTQERVSLSSLDRTYRLLREILHKMK